ncbi:Pyrophosphate--fructose 6-phosphate 1-phosphotransferase [bioreactor metagenome]|uniref:Pyrophosphate--fructose 6-phosphate 1-phosphotransferase n=1 Tax=bioreactor metagenome TaxID=1076179 RepID=A0A645CAE2_9ZZZZ
MHSMDKNFTGQMVGVKRKPGEKYDVEFFTTAASNVANHVKNFPAEWILPHYRGIAKEAYDYLRPLIEGTPVIIYKDGIPAYVKPYYMR